MEQRPNSLYLFTIHQTALHTPSIRTQKAIKIKLNKSGLHPPLLPCQQDLSILYTLSYTHTWEKQFQTPNLGKTPSNKSNLDNIIWKGRRKFSTRWCKNEYNRNQLNLFLITWGHKQIPKRWNNPYTRIMVAYWQKNYTPNKFASQWVGTWLHTLVS